MKTLAILTLSAALVSAPALAASDGISLRWMGPESFSCGEWPKDAAYNQPRKGLMLNWVLGFLSAASLQPGSPDLLNNVDNPSIAGWIDKYCAANPLDSIPTATFKLQGELTRREQPAPRR
jgi:hypothetical protein